MANAMVDPAVAAGIKKALRRLTVGLVLVYVGMAATAAWIYTNSKANTDALCALRGDLELRVARSQNFLRENPTGIPGITPNVILDGIDGQKRTIKALSGLSC